MHNYKLSICLPAIRTHLWENFYQSIVSSVGKHSWQLIMVGPNDPPPFFNDKTNFKYIKDYGSPARCGQIATSVAEGELMMWASDDGIFTQNSIAACIEKHDSLGYKDTIALRYTEGRNYQGSMMHPDYWMAHHHPTLRVVPEHYKILMVGMFKLEYFRELGGWDCRFEHLNMNTHDLSFRLQNDGGKIYESDMYVCNHDWNPNQGDHVPVQQAYEQNDLALFQEIYKNYPNLSYLERPIKIDYFNWNKSPMIWKRRFG
jgi:hypothetical protein